MDTELVIRARSGDHGWLEDAFGPLGMELDDVRMAIAFTTDTSAPEQYLYTALRLPGVEADVLSDALLRRAAEDRGWTPPLDFVWPTQVIDDRNVVTALASDAVTWTANLPKGEVLFILQGSGGVTLEEAVSALP